jgi:hypothetical protein
MRLLFRAVLTILIFGSSAPAQQPDVRPYESEEDLWEALREGEIAFDEFLELLDIHRVGADDVVLPRSDWEQLPGSDAGYLVSPDSTQSLTHFTPISAESRAPPRRRLSWKVRSGYDADLMTQSEGDGYSIVRLRYNDNLSAVLDLWHDGNEVLTRRRTVVYEPGQWRLEFGNMEPRWGRGLVIGRRTRFIGGSAARPLKGEFSYPSRSRFNGMSLTFGRNCRLTGSLLTSWIKTERFADYVTGVHLEYGREWWHLGYSTIVGYIEKRDTLEAIEDGDSNSSVTSAAQATSSLFTGEFPLYRTTVSGIHLRVGSNRRALLGEVAVTDVDASAKAVELLWGFSQGRLYARAWSYGRRFVNPWGGGPAHPDRETICLDTIDETYSTRTTGERGFSLSTRIDVSASTQLRWNWMTHRESPDAPLIHHWAVRARLRAGRLTVTPFARGKSVEGDDNLYALGSYARLCDSDKRLNGRFELGRHRTGADLFLRAGFGFRYRLGEYVRLAPRMRWVDPDLNESADGYWYFYFTETVIPGTLGRFEAALVWQRYEDRERDDRIELRVRSMAGGG